jgi:hypothetical protein
VSVNRGIVEGYTGGADSDHWNYKVKLLKAILVVLIVTTGIISLNFTRKNHTVDAV